MKYVSCKRTMRQIPLYVAGDLTGAPRGEIAKHLAACEGCGQLALEFRENNSLLVEACAPPEFSDEFYENIRHTVLREMARDDGISKPLFVRRWIYATAFAITLMAAGLVLLHFRRATSGPRQFLAAIAPVSVTTTTLPRGSTPRRATQKPIRRANLARSNSRQIDPVRKSDAPEVASVPSERAPASEVSRIEIQTGNPNIRIIWFTQAAGRESRDNNRDKDEPRDRE